MGVLMLGGPGLSEQNLHQNLPDRSKLKQHSKQ
jgi:hypothetical protein